MLWVECLCRRSSAVSKLWSPVMVFGGDEGLDEVVRVELLWWDSCPYKMKGPEFSLSASKTQQEGGHLLTRAGPSTDTNFAGPLILDF